MNEAFSFKDVELDMSDIPSYASLDEATLYVVEATEILFNDLKKEIGLNELGVFETTGNTISYVVEANEGEDKESLKDKAAKVKTAAVNKGAAFKESIKKLGAAIMAKLKGLFEAALRKMNDLMASAANAFGKRLDADKLKAGLEGTKIEFKSGDHENLMRCVDIGHENQTGWDDVVNEIKGNGDGQLTKEAIKKYFMGEEKTQTLDAKGVDDIVKLIGKFNSNNIWVKGAYKAASTLANSMIKAMLKSPEEPDNEEFKEMQDNAKAITLVFGTALSCYYNLIRQDVAVLIKLNNKVTKANVVNKAKDAAHAVKHEVDNAKAVAKTAKDVAKDQLANKKGKKEEEKTEALAASAIEDVDNKTMTYTEEVESLFNWSF